MLLYCHNFQRDPFRTYVLHFDGDERLSLAHYHSGHPLLRLADLPGFADWQPAEVAAALDGLDVADPAAVPLQTWNAERNELPEWLLLHNDERAVPKRQDFILKLGNPVALLLYDLGHGSVSEPIYDCPHTTPEQREALRPLAAQAAEECFSAMRKDLLSEGFD